MKILQGVAQASGYWTTRLVDPEDLDLLRFEETGELPEGYDFAVLWDGEWREGRCYNSSHRDRKSTRLNSSHTVISYAVFCLKKKNPGNTEENRTDSRRLVHAPQPAAEACPDDARLEMLAAAGAPLLRTPRLMPGTVAVVALS